MPRPKRADEANGIYHALNRGNARNAIFKKDADYDAFERILAEGLTLYPCRILSYQLMPNHWHFVLTPTQDGGMSNFLRWVTLTQPQRYHAHYGTSGEGHVYQERFKSLPGTGRRSLFRSIALRGAKCFTWQFSSPRGGLEVGIAVPLVDQAGTGAKVTFAMANREASQLGQSR